ncbi:hypothetical protein ACFVGP_32875, partial [Streptomyces rochei]|uniref:galactose-binding domain-containing protein n=1 Tax=Streptomyces rochei TaxID=1928 RepID=UPI003691860E
ASYAKAYTIQVSDDGENWTTVHEVTDGNGGIDDIEVEEDAAAGVVDLDVGVAGPHRIRWGPQPFPEPGRVVTHEISSRTASDGHHGATPTG